MPIYTYQTNSSDGGCSVCQSPLEIMQKMSDAPLTECPICCQPMRRRVSLPSRAITNSSASKTSDAAINRSGMTKYVNIGDGKYEKAAGPSDAPSIIDRNDRAATTRALSHLD